jgi:5-keto-L-gluconate epimerase
MKIGVAIADKNALPSAFVVFRGIEESIKKAAILGYDGVELALIEKRQTDVKLIKNLVSKYHMEIPVVSTGQVYAGSGLYFTHPDIVIRNKAIEVFKGLIEVASEFGAMVNMGRVRGFVADGETVQITEERFKVVVEELLNYAKALGVALILEPINRYESNFINNLDEGVALINKLKINGLKLMPDVFHMNIEDSSIEENLVKYKDYLSYVHFADSNRLAPGWGHLNFKTIIDALVLAKYDDWVTIEILPKPDPASAAKQAITFLRQYINK